MRTRRRSTTKKKGGLAQTHGSHWAAGIKTIKLKQRIVVTVTVRARQIGETKKSRVSKAGRWNDGVRPPRWGIDDDRRQDRGADATASSVLESAVSIVSYGG